MPQNSRRNFLKQSTGAAATVSGFGFLSNLPLVTASEGMLAPDLVDFGNGIEPTVQLIEKTPRAELLEKMAVRVKAGLSYREVLAALLLAGIRNVQPSPSVGFKFHCVLVVNSCHLASMSGPDSDRWLPIFWALDYFKSSQADESNRSGWRMSPVKESLVPNAINVRKVFADAMESWDVEKADAGYRWALPNCRCNRSFQFVCQVCSTRLSLDWSQGDLPGEFLAYASGDRLGFCGTGASIIGVCTFES